MENLGFWIAAGGIGLAVAASLIAAVFQRHVAAPSAAAFDLQLYRQQLRDVDRDLGEGMIAQGDADRLRAEISRRILEADRAGRGAPAAQRASGTARVIAAMMVAGVVVPGAVFGYLRLGAPGYPDMPLASRLAAAEAFRENRPSQAMAEVEAPRIDAVTPDPEMADLMAKLRQAVADRPGDITGLALLARNEAALGNLGAATKAQAQLIAAKGSTATGQDHALLAEIMIRLAGGYVSPEAEAELIRALELEPANGMARYYSGLMFAQGDRADRAFTMWRGLLEDSAADDPWVEPIRAQIAEIATRAGVKYDFPGPAGPTAEQVDEAADMAPEDRLAMIKGMVEGLSDRLASQGGPVEDWARLITSLGVLGDMAQARAIYAEAQGAFAGRASDLEVLQAAAAAAGAAE